MERWTSKASQTSNAGAGTVRVCITLHYIIMKENNKYAFYKAVCRF